MNKTLLALVLLFQFSILATSQTAQIQGVVKDAETGETLPFCNVFINNTTISTATDIDGKYVLDGLEPGPIELSFSFLGYEAQTKIVSLSSGSTLTVDLSLTPFVSELNEVEIKASRDRAWKRDLKKFTNLFLGNNDLASRSEIENPWVIDFPKSENRGTFIASADLPMEITNRYLGYQIRFDLSEFFQSQSDYRIAGAASFMEMQPSSATELAAWERNRLEAYRKSAMNMFRSVLKGEHEKEGFFLYGEKSGRSDGFYFRSDTGGDRIGKSSGNGESEKLFEPAETPGEYLIYLEGKIDIQYQKGAQVNSSKDAPLLLSELKVNGGVVRVKENGAVLNPEDLVFSGDMGDKRVSTLLPLDYDAERAIALQNLDKTASGLQERIYLHTDRGYYWPNENILFKAYIRYGNLAFADELSKVLHVELLDDTGYLMMHRVFRIENGVAQGFLDFAKDKPFEKGNYMLKAYTAWSTNYYDDGVFFQPIQVLDWDEFPPQTDLQSTSDGISFFSDKLTYGPNETVTLNISAQNAEGQPVNANLSVAVLNLNQTQPAKEPFGISEALRLKKSDLDLNLFSGPREFGITLEASMLNSKQNLAQGSAEFLLNGIEAFEKMSTGSDRRFTLVNQQFEGEFIIAMKSLPQKNEGEVTKSLEIKRFGEMIRPPKPEYPKVVLADNPFLSREEIAEGMEADEMLLEEAIIERAREPSIGAMAYGTPEYSVNVSDLPNLSGDTRQFMYLLAAKVPGMTVSGNPPGMSLRSGPPLVLINGVPANKVGGTAFSSVKIGSSTYEILSNLNVLAIERVEVMIGTTPQYGDQGRYGVLSIILKTGLELQEEMNAEVNSFEPFVFEGFPTNMALRQQTEKINNPNETQRPILYWTPNLITRESELSQKIEFTIGNEAGPMWMEIRGMTDLGEPIFGRFLINGN